MLSAEHRKILEEALQSEWHTMYCPVLGPAPNREQPTIVSKTEMGVKSLTEPHGFRAAGTILTGQITRTEPFVLHHKPTAAELAEADRCFRNIIGDRQAIEEVLGNGILRGGYYDLQWSMWKRWHEDQGLLMIPFMTPKMSQYEKADMGIMVEDQVWFQSLFQICVEYGGQNVRRDRIGNFGAYVSIDPFRFSIARNNVHVEVGDWNRASPYGRAWFAGHATTEFSPCAGHGRLLAMVPGQEGVQANDAARRHSMLDGGVRRLTSTGAKLPYYRGGHETKKLGPGWPRYADLLLETLQRTTEELLKHKMDMMEKEWDYVLFRLRKLGFLVSDRVLVREIGVVDTIETPDPWLYQSWEVVVYANDTGPDVLATIPLVDCYDMPGIRRGLRGF